MTLLSHRSSGNGLVRASMLTMTLVVVLTSPAAAKEKNAYQQTNLVADVPGLAAHTDPNLVNAWGMASSSTSPFWVSDNGKGVSTLYDADGQAFPPPPLSPSPLIVTIPPTGSAPTGQVFNDFLATSPSDFVVTSGGSSGPSLFIFATEDGTIAGWNPCVPPPPGLCFLSGGTFLSSTAILAVNNAASGAIYKGLAIGSNASGNFLYAANFHAGTIDVFDKTFAPARLAGSFSDPDIPAGFAPFNIQNLEGQLYVTYAKQDADKEDDVAGQGHGFVDVFDTDGHFIQRVATHGQLNSPWGLVFAPADFGRFSNDLLVGNFGDGRINAYSRKGGHFHFQGQLRGPDGKRIMIDGLWALRFGNGATAGPTTTLFFTAGPNDEQHGLFGSLRACHTKDCAETP